MDAFSGLALGFGQVLDPYNLLFLSLGVFLGLVIGVLPGLGGTAGVAIVLPITLFISPNAAIMLLSGIYWGAMFGGAVTTILFGIPGEPWSVPLMFDGRPLARSGRTSLVLTLSFTVSLLSAIVCTVLFTFLALPLSELALAFGPVELFAVLLLTFATFVGLGGGSPFKTLIMMAVGFLLATVGLDVVTGQPRFTFGSVALLQGFDFVPVTVGLFGLGEVLYGAIEKDAATQQASARLGLGDLWESLREIKRRIGVVIASTLTGFWVGILPGLGATPASFMAYGMARKVSRQPEKLGKGAIEGILAPEAANDGAGIGSVLPMITLGIPGSPTAAVIMAGLMTWGLTPGPTLFAQKPDLVWGFIASLYIANIVAFLLCFFATPALAAIMRIPAALLTPIIVVLSLLGSYSINNSMLDVWVTLVFGVLGLVLKMLKFPVEVLVVALVLGLPTEKAMRQTLIMSNGSLGILFHTPFAAITTLAALALFLMPVIQSVKQRLQARRLARSSLSEAAAGSDG